jgi:WAS family protein 3
MPLPKRVIEPVHVARGTLPDDFPLVSELEAVTNGTLANTVRQLSSLSRHAEDMFGELAKDAQQLYDRSNSLQARIDRLAIKVTQLDSTVEEVSLQDIHMRKAFKSTVAFDQQVSWLLGSSPSAVIDAEKCSRCLFFWSGLSVKWLRFY